MSLEDIIYEVGEIYPNFPSELIEEMYFKEGQDDDLGDGEEIEEEQYGREVEEEVFRIVSEFKGTLTLWPLFMSTHVPRAFHVCLPPFRLLIITPFTGHGMSLKDIVGEVREVFPSFPEKSIEALYSKII